MNLYNPYWWAALPQQHLVSNKLNVYKLVTNSVTLSSDSVDFGINFNHYRVLPNESIVLLSITNAVPEGGESLPITIVTPTIDSTTKITVVDTTGNEITGNNVTENTERLLYINKVKGVIRLLETINS